MAMAMQDQHELKPDEKAYIAIGRFIFQFSQLEFSLRFHLAEKIGLKDEYFYAITTGYDFAMLCTITKTIFSRTLDDEAFERLETLIGKCHELNADRVRVAHGFWVVGNEGGRVHHAARNSLEPKIYFEEAEKLNAKADLACELRAELEHIVYSLPTGLFERRKTD
jgi:hypothetical protein